MVLVPDLIIRQVVLCVLRSGSLEPVRRTRTGFVAERVPLFRDISNGRGALAENPEVALAVGERDWEGRERPHCLPAILSWNQF